MKKIAALLMAGLMVFTLVSCSSTKSEESQQTEQAETAAFVSTDYSDPENWLINEYDSPEKADTDVDVVFIYGTVVEKADQENGIALISDEMKEMAMAGGEDVTFGVFDDGTRMYIPCYRQLSLEKALTSETHEDFLNMLKDTEVCTDICGAMDYYFQNYNEGRPFILAGYSQGSACVQVALEKYFGEENHRAYLDQMVAAYSIAYGVDKNWVAENDYLKFATGETDTGVIISWNTEGPGEKGDNFLLADNPSDTLVINPINWKTDDTYASGAECLGSRVDGKVVTPGLYNLQLDPERGSLICDNNEDYLPEIWGGKSLHGYEISMTYQSIRQNMHDRIDAFLAQQGA